MANRAQLYRYRGNHCAHCGMPVEEMVSRYGTFDRMFELHHVEPQAKHPQYSALMQRTISAEQIEEVDKCVLLCRECHGIVHAQDIEGSIVIQREIGDRVVSQELKGWFVVDGVDRTMTFLSNERSLIQPCLVTLGRTEPEEHLVLELMQDDRLINWLRDIETLQRIEVVSLPDGELLLEINYKEGRQAAVKMALGLPLFAMDLDVSEGDSSYLWLRNGMLLTKEGRVITEGMINFPLKYHV